MKIIYRIYKINNFFTDGSHLSITKHGKFWYKGNKSHRDRLPAVICERYNSWLVNGVRHREVGPAFEYKNRESFFYLNGREYIEEDYWKKVNENNLQNSR